MTEKTGLYDQANFDAFCDTWRPAIMKEAGSWCQDPDAQALLTDAVLMDFRRQYLDRTPPERMGYFIRAQTCLVFSETGSNIASLSRYIDVRKKDFSAPTAPAKSAAPAAAPAGAPSPGEAPAAEAALGEAPADSGPQNKLGGMSIPRSRVRARRNRAVSGEAAPSEAPAEALAEAAAAPAAAPEPPKPAEPPRAYRKADTYIDPNRTLMWSPGDLASTDHVIQEVFLPDEEVEEERSSELSLVNTLLFIVMFAALAFMIYESQIIQHYML